jgi:AraC family transcriptional regulator
MLYSLDQHERAWATDMKEQSTMSQQTPTRASTDQITTPLLYLSSTEAGWEGLVAQAFYEPMEYEPMERADLVTPATEDISLVMFTGGTMSMTLRYANGPWQELHLRHEDLLLSSGEDAPYEVCWKILASVPARTLHLHLSKDLLARTAEEVADFDPTHLSLVGHTGFHDPLLSQIALTLWRELEQPSPAGKLYAQSAAQLLAVHLLRHYSSEMKTIKEPAQKLTHQQMRRVIDFVHDHLSLDLSLEELAEQTGFSAYHFARLFRQTTGESPHQFVLRQRVERAQCLLKERDLPLVHIALESGFASQSHLTQVFKRYLGLTPRVYRQNCSI